MKILSCILITLCSVSLLQGKEIYVSPDGDNQGKGTKADPLKSLPKAKMLMREALEKDPQQDAFIYLLDGVHRMNNPLVLTMVDNPAPGYKYVIRSAPKNKAILDASREIAKGDWKKFNGNLKGLPKEAQGKVYFTDLAAKGSGKYHIRTLFHKGEMLRRARTEGFVPQPIGSTADTRYESFRVKYPSGAMRNWDNFEDGELVAQTDRKWIVNYLPLESINSSKRIAKVAMECTYKIAPRHENEKSNLINTWVENVADGMTEPGSWMYDSHLQRVYYWPEGGDKGLSGVSYPRMTEMILVQGRVVEELEGDGVVSDVIIRNLTFRGADRLPIVPSDRTFQHEGEVYDKGNAMVRFRNVEDCRIINCVFEDSGACGFRADLYAQGVQVKDSVFRRLGGGAILFSGYGPGLKDVNKGNTIHNNIVTDVSRMYQMFAGITLWQSGENIVSNNRVNDLPYDGIYLAGVRAVHYGGRHEWDGNLKTHAGKNYEGPPRINRDFARLDEMKPIYYFSDMMPYLHTRNNQVMDNEVYDTVHTLDDGNAIYVSCTGLDNVVERNLVYDSYYSLNASIRFDASQYNTIVENNVILGRGVKCKQFNTVRNNYLFGSSILLTDKTQKGGDISRNVYYHIPSIGDVYSMSAASDREKLLNLLAPNKNYFAGENNKLVKAAFQESRDYGQDKQSKWGDAGFKNLRQGDIGWKSDSPLRGNSMGIKPVNLKGIGVDDGDAQIERFAKAMRKALDK